MNIPERLLALLKLTEPNGTRLISRENSQLEFKQSFNWGSKAAYAKTLAGFANNRGGYIVFGVTNSPREVVGLANDNFETHDEAVVSQYLITNFAPGIDFEKGVVAVSGRQLGYIYVHPAERKPIICSQNDAENREGDIYFRYKGRSQRIKYPELAAIMSETQRSESDRWFKLFERIARIGIDHTALLDTKLGKVEGDRGVLLIDDALLAKVKFIQEGKFRETGKPTLRLIGDVTPVGAQPADVPVPAVAITNAPDAPLVRLAEADLLKTFPFDYRHLTDTLRNRYSNFVENQEYHDRRKELAQNPNLMVTRYLDPLRKNGSKKDYYSELILSEFDKLYTKKQG